MASSSPLGDLARKAAKLPFPLGAPPVPQGVEPLPGKARSGPDYDTAWARKYPARLARVALVEGVARPAVSALASPEREGLDRLDGLARTGEPVIFAPNHHSHLDTPIAVTSIPEPWRHKLFVGVAADYFFRTPLTSALSALAIGAVPIERTKVSRRSTDSAGRRSGRGVARVSEADSSALALGILVDARASLGPLGRSACSAGLIACIISRTYPYASHRSR